MTNFCLMMATDVAPDLSNYGYGCYVVPVPPTQKNIEPTCVLTQLEDKVYELKIIIIVSHKASSLPIEELFQAP